MGKAQACGLSCSFLLLLPPDNPILFYIVNKIEGSRSLDLARIQTNTAQFLLGGRCLPSMADIADGVSVR